MVFFIIVFNLMPYKITWKILEQLPQIYFNPLAADLIRKFCNEEIFETAG